MPIQNSVRIATEQLIGEGSSSGWSDWSDTSAEYESANQRSFKNKLSQLIDEDSSSSGWSDYSTTTTNTSPEQGSTNESSQLTNNSTISFQNSRGHSGMPNGYESIESQLLYSEDHEMEEDELSFDDSKPKECLTASEIPLIPVESEMGKNEKDDEDDEHHDNLDDTGNVTGDSKNDIDSDYECKRRVLRPRVVRAPAKKHKTPDSTEHVNGDSESDRDSDYDYESKRRVLKSRLVRTPGKKQKLPFTTVFTCPSPSCSQRYSTMQRIQAHVFAKHPNEYEPLLGQKRMQCPECNRFFHGCFGLETHQSKFHPETYNKHFIYTPGAPRIPHLQVKPSPTQPSHNGKRTRKTKVERSAGKDGDKFIPSSPQPKKPRFRPCPCPVCGRIFVARHVVKKHLTNIHPDVLSSFKILPSDSIAKRLIEKQ